jgi:hypothetical protein
MLWVRNPSGTQIKTSEVFKTSEVCVNYPETRISQQWQELALYRLA